MARKAEEENPDSDLPAITSTGSDLQPQPEPVAKGKPAKKSPLPEWRLEQLRKAGKARGEQLKRDKAHQSRAGKSLAAQRGTGYMQEIGSAGHTKALAANPDLQTTAGKAGLGKPKQRKRTKPQPAPPTEEGQTENE